MRQIPVEIRGFRYRLTEDPNGEKSCISLTPIICSPFRPSDHGCSPLVGPTFYSLTLLSPDHIRFNWALVLKLSYVIEAYKQGIMEGVSSENFNWGEADAYSTQYLKGPVQSILKGLSPQRILDLGCGNGSLTRHIAALGCEVVGCDPDEHGLEIARRNVPGATFVTCGVYDESTPLDGEQFDVVLSSEVIEHLFYPGRLVEFADRLLTPKGHLVLTTPYHGYLKNLALSVFDKWDFHHTPLFDGGHIKFWSRRTLSKLVEQYDFSVTDFHGAGRVTWLWKSMILVCQKK